MSEQSLREALETQVGNWGGYVADDPTMAATFRLAAEKLRELLDAHPVKPLPTREQIEEIIATRVMRYDSAADVRAVDDNDPEALDAGTDALLALINGSES